MKNVLRRALELTGLFGNEKRDRELELLRAYKELGDIRYNDPKKAPNASDKLVTDTIERTEIYRRVRDHILSVQHKQVAYGLDKYPEPLNADTWSHIETIDHIIDETIDQLHYLTMLRIKLENDAENELISLREEYERAGYCVDTTLNPGEIKLVRQDIEVKPLHPIWMPSTPVEGFMGGDYDGDTAKLLGVEVPINFDTTKLKQEIDKFNENVELAKILNEVKGGNKE